MTRRRATSIPSSSAWVGWRRWARAASERCETPSAALVRDFADRFRNDVWPGERLPDVFYDPRSLEDQGGPRAVLHAKCVVTDGRWTLLTSANFTEAAQERNIEAGVLVDDPRLAARVTRQLDELVHRRALRRLPTAPHAD